jgi:hypothetical protein
MNNITLLLGAGFSKLADLPSGNDLNECLEEMTAYSENPLAKFILQKYLEKDTPFNYEEFYDLLLRYDLVHRNVVPLSIKEKKEFKKLFPDNDIVNCFPSNTDKVIDFEKKYTDKLFRLLNIDCESITSTKCDCFIDFIKQYTHETSVNIFTLNHDVLVENLFVQNKIDFSDGFTNEPFRFQYRLNQTRNPIRDFRHFTNTFKSNINLFKLHGSIDLYYLRERESGKPEFVRTKNIELPYVVFDSNYIDSKSDNKYDSHPYPQFLSGKDSKKFYLKTPYFKEIFNSLKRSIIHTEILIIIGYSFEDDHVNQILKETISKRGFNSGLKIIIVDYIHSEKARKSFTKKIHSKTYIDLIDMEECIQNGLFKTKDEFPFYLFDKGVSEFFNSKLYRFLSES